MEILLGKLWLRMNALSFTSRAVISLWAISGTICADWLIISTSRSCDLYAICDFWGMAMNMTMTMIMTNPMATPAYLMVLYN